MVLSQDNVYNTLQKSLNELKELVLIKLHVEASLRQHTCYLVHVTISTYFTSESMWSIRMHDTHVVKIGGNYYTCPSL